MEKRKADQITNYSTDSKNSSAKLSNAAISSDTNAGNRKEAAAAPPRMAIVPPRKKHVRFKPGLAQKQSPSSSKSTAPSLVRKHEHFLTVEEKKFIIKQTIKLRKANEYGKSRASALSVLEKLRKAFPRLHFLNALQTRVAYDNTRKRVLARLKLSGVQGLTGSCKEFYQLFLADDSFRTAAEKISKAPKKARPSRRILDSSSEDEADLPAPKQSSVHPQANGKGTSKPLPGAPKTSGTLQIEQTADSSACNLENRLRHLVKFIVEDTGDSGAEDDEELEDELRLPAGLVLSRKELVILENFYLSTGFPEMIEEDNDDGSENRVDFWTLSSTGCPCPPRFGEDSSLKCACCDEEVGCLCPGAHDRCAQCGLEMFCGKMCNMTIDMSQLKTRHGAIYSPPISGSIFCSYYIVANRDTVIKLLLYRIQGIGRFDPHLKRCVGGYLQIIDGVRALKGNSSAVHVFCGADSRFERPVIVFKYRAMAVIQYWTEISTSPRFMLQYEFEDKSEVESYMTGGTAIPNSECDFIWRHLNCSNPEVPCEFSTPGYPGLYPNFQHCRYFFRSMEPGLQIRLQFKSFEFPIGDCDTHYANIFDGAYSSRTDPPLQTLCGVPKLDELIFFSTGPSMVLEVVTGSLPPPYTYTGFHGTIVFGNEPPEGTIGNRVAGTFCDWTFYSNTTPSANFRSPIDWYPAKVRCTFTFIPVVAAERAIITLQSYFIEADHCATNVVLNELNEELEAVREIKRICGPTSKYTQENGPLEEYASGPGKPLQLVFFSEPGNLILGKVSEWVAGAFIFHNDRLLGTKKLNTVCDYIISQTEHPSTGSLTATKFDPASFDASRPSTPSFTCNTEFHPNPHNSIELTLRHASLIRPGDEMIFSSICSTECDRTGCRCVLDESDSHRIDQVPYIVLQSLTKPSVEIACFCGDVTDALPVTISVAEGATVRFHRPASPQSESLFYDYDLGYAFKESIYECSKPSTKKGYGILQASSKVNISSNAVIYHIQCSWNVEVKSANLISLDARFADLHKSGRKNKSIQNAGPCQERNSLKVFPTGSPKAREKGIEFCQSTAVTVNSSKMSLKLLATGTQLKHKILWREVAPASQQSSSASKPRGDRIWNMWALTVQMLIVRFGFW